MHYSTMHHFGLLLEQAQQQLNCVNIVNHFFGYDLKFPFHCQSVSFISMLVMRHSYFLRANVDYKRLASSYVTLILIFHAAIENVWK